MNFCDDICGNGFTPTSNNKRKLIRLGNSYFTLDCFNFFELPKELLLTAFNLKFFLETLNRAIFITAENKYLKSIPLLPWYAEHIMIMKRHLS